MSLPKGYKRVEYIESSGTQYIDTGYTIGSENGTKMRIEADVAYLGTSGWQTDGFSCGNPNAVYFGLQATRWVTSNGHPSGLPTFSAGTRYSIVFDTSAGTMSVNGFSGTWTPLIPNTSYNFLIFAQSTASSITYHSKRTWSYKIYDDGVLVRDYVPCVNSDDVAGLYDDVNGVFYGNAGTGEFIAAPVYAGLPSGYTQVEYIESNGTQYIDTGFYPAYGSRIMMDISGVPNSANYIFGTRDSASGTATLQFGFYRNDATSGRVDYFGTNAYGSISDSTVRTTIYMNGNEVTAYGVTIATTAVSSGVCTYPLFLLALNNAGSAAINASGRVYSCAIYDNTTLVRNYIPCVNSDGAAGLYDLKNGVFYGNAGTGEFTVGKEVPSYAEFTQLDYIETSGTQYINTGFIPNQNTTIEIDVMVNPECTSSVALFGSRHSTTLHAFTVFAITGSTFRFDYSAEQATVSNDYSAHDRHVLKLCAAGAYIDDALVATYTQVNWQSEYPIYLLGLNSAGSVVGRGAMTLFSAKIYDGETLVREFIPGISLDGDVGVYDIVNSEFYGNAGTGEIIAGPEYVPPVDEPEIPIEDPDRPAELN